MKKRENLVFIWDFDNVLFKNKFYVFSSFYLKLKRIIPLKELESLGFQFNNKDILVTGRRKGQRSLILYLLKQRGFEFSRTFFTDDNSLPIGNPRFFFERYVNWKFSIIIELNKEFNGKIIIIDDNVQLIKTCRARGINAFYFNLNDKRLLMQLQQRPSCIDLKLINNLSLLENLSK